MILKVCVATQNLRYIWEAQNHLPLAQLMIYQNLHHGIIMYLKTFKELKTLKEFPSWNNYVLKDIV